MGEAPTIDVARRNYFRVLDLRSITADLLDELEHFKTDVVSIAARWLLTRRARLLLASEDSYVFEPPPLRLSEQKAAYTLLKCCTGAERQAVLLRFCYACGHELPCSCGKDI